MKSYQYEGVYLENFDECDRSMVTNQFCYSYREWCQGVPSCEELIRSVCARVLRNFHDRNPRADLMEGIYNSLRDEEALRFAQFIIQREQMPATERARLKRQQAEGFREKHMASLPVTPKQISFLTHLGCTEMPTDRATASKMIDELLKRKKAA